tara:strand:- start:479 stop:1417 length:939 start_codon:yes stop_codon:yes gene_type:complete
MILKKPKFWDYKKPNFIAYLLLPFSYIVHIYNNLNLKKKISFYGKIKTICVGNIYVGGTGKTPLSIKIIKILNNLNIKTCFIKKEYSNQLDEQKLLSSNGKLFCKKNRVIATNDAFKENFDVAIFDDGLQDKNIKYDINIVCFNEKTEVGNGCLLPAGPLRESIQNLKKYDAVFLNGNKINESDFEKKIKKDFPHIKIFKSTYSIKNLHELDTKEQYLVFAGIGNFDSFIDMLKKNNFRILDTIAYPDHYNYSQSDIKKILEIAKLKKAKIITTEKDYIKIAEEYKKEIKAIKIELNIANENKFNDFLNERL